MSNVTDWESKFKTVSSGATPPVNAMAQTYGSPSDNPQTTTPANTTTQQPGEAAIAKTGIFNIPVVGSLLRNAENSTESYGRMAGEGALDLFGRLPAFVALKATDALTGQNKADQYLASQKPVFLNSQNSADQKLLSGDAGQSVPEVAGRALNFGQTAASVKIPLPGQEGAQATEYLGKLLNSNKGWEGMVNAAPKEVNYDAASKFAWDTAKNQTTPVKNALIQLIDNSPKGVGKGKDAIEYATNVGQDVNWTDPGAKAQDTAAAIYKNALVREMQKGNKPLERAYQTYAQGKAVQKALPIVGKAISKAVPGLATAGSLIGGGLVVGKALGGNSSSGNP